MAFLAVFSWTGAARAEPLVVKVSYCTPYHVGSSHIDGGYANAPEDRGTKVRIGFETQGAESYETAAGDTEKIQICYYDATGEHCPETEPWVLYDEQGPVGSLPDEEQVSTDPNETQASKTVVFQASETDAGDWANASEAQTVLYPKVNGVADVTVSGYCKNWSVMAANADPGPDRFWILGTSSDDALLPFDPLDACTDSSKIPGAWLPKSGSLCFSNAQAAYVLAILEQIDEGQQERLQRSLTDPELFTDQLDPGVRKSAWHNGYSNFRHVLLRPEQNVLLHPSNYHAAAFWRYVYEQFGYPVTIPANIGGDAPTLVILEPTTTLPAFVGHPDGPAGTHPVLVKLALGDGTPFTKIDPADVTLYVKDDGTPMCDPLGPGDFSSPVVSGGHAWLVANLPEDCYPTAPVDDLLDLHATVDGLDAVAEDALRVSDDPFHQSTMLVLDTSDSMNDDDKIDAAKIVAKALVEAMIPGSGPSMNDLGIVQFRGCAETVLDITTVDDQSASSIESTIDSLGAGGGTSIGDGALWAQGVLGVEYDALAPGARPSRQTMVVISDGLNEAENVPYRYYLGEEDDLEDHENAAGDCEDWPSGISLTRDARDTANDPLPVVSTVAIGVGADLTELAALAKFGAGVGPIPIKDTSQSSLMEITVDFADAWTAAFNAASDYERVFVARTFGVRSSLSGIVVEPGATELRVLLVSATEPTQYAELVSPSSDEHAPTSGLPGGEATVFHILDPEPGTWTIVSPAPTTTQGPSVFVEAVVKSRFRFFATADVPAVLPLPSSSEPPYESGRWTGSDVLLHAVPREDGPVTGCLVEAGILRPGEETRETVTLRDDGHHRDGRPGDGVFGGLYAHTGAAGVYDVELRATCTSPVSEETVLRVSRTAFELHGADDEDDDGMDDAWEQRHGLEPEDPDDAEQDEDDDGLTNLDELRHGTDPRMSDTDRSGESDGSEVARGNSPRDEVDDEGHPPVLHAIPGNEMVVLGLGMISDGVAIHVDKGPTREGPFTRATEYAGYGYSVWVDTSATNDEDVCYRARASGEGVVTAWSDVVCTASRIDPHVPTMRVVDVSTDEEEREVAFVLELSDDPRPSSLFPYDMGTEVSGPDGLRFFTRPSFVEAEWQSVTAEGSVADEATEVELSWDPETSTITASMPEVDQTEIWIQVRDAAGNESAPFSLFATLAPAP